MHARVNYCVYVPVSVTARLKVTKIIQLKFYLPLMKWAPIELEMELISFLNYFVIPTKYQINRYHPFNMSF